MKNWFKKILAVAAFMLISLAAQSQGSLTINSTNYNKWVQVCNTACGKGSFYVYVNKYYNQTDKYYYYEIYVWSESYYKNCTSAYTYIDEVKIYANNIQVLILDYYLASPKTDTFNGWNYMAYVYSSKENETIKITWDSISPY